MQVRFCSESVPGRKADRKKRRGWKGRTREGGGLIEIALSEKHETCNCRCMRDDLRYDWVPWPAQREEGLFRERGLGGEEVMFIPHSPTRRTMFSRDKRTLNLTCATDGRRLGRHREGKEGSITFLSVDEVSLRDQEIPLRSAQSLLDNGGHKFHNLSTVTGG